MGEGKPEKVREVRIQLAEPIQRGSETVEELVLRRPKGKDMRKLPAEPDIGSILDWAGELAGQPPSFVDELDVEDVEQLIEGVSRFFESGQLIGGLSSPS